MMRPAMGRIGWIWVMAALLGGGCVKRTTPHVYPQDLTHPNPVRRTAAAQQFAARRDASQLPAAFDLLLDEEGQIRSIAFSAIREIMPEGEEVAFYGYQSYLPDTVRVGMVERLEALWKQTHPVVSDPGAADVTKEAERG